MQVRKIGTWEETRVGSGYDSGFYLEAVDIPRDRPRYAAVSYSALWEDTQTKPLARGECVELDLTEEDLASRIDEC